MVLEAMALCKNWCLLKAKRATICQKESLLSAKKNQKLTEVLLFFSFFGGEVFVSNVCIVLSIEVQRVGCVRGVVSPQEEAEIGNFDGLGQKGIILSGNPR